MSDDLINRQAAIEAVLSIGHAAVLYDGDAVVRMSAINYVLRNLPTAQPEIIRCKDCENWDVSWQNDDEPNYHYCPLADGMRRGDFYCADAERKGEQDD